MPKMACRSLRMTATKACRFSLPRPSRWVEGAQMEIVAYGNESRHREGAAQVVPPCGTGLADAGLSPHGGAGGILARIEARRPGRCAGGYSDGLAEAETTLARCLGRRRPVGKWRAWDVFPETVRNRPLAASTESIWFFFSRMTMRPSRDEDPRRWRTGKESETTRTSWS